MQPGDLLAALLAHVRAAAREGAAEALTAHAAPALPTAPLVDKREIARTFDVSVATITRLVQEGAPHTFVGASPRFDVEAFRAWLDARGRQGTKAKPLSGPIPGVRLLSRGGRGRS
jgi:hypothetical protein